MEISLGFSPCPNDCFIFDALVHNKIDTEGLHFNYQLHDVEKLNQMAFKEELDVTKLSYHAFIYLTNAYQLLDSGSALGFNCGPLLISKNKFTTEEFNKVDRKIAIPGKYTTANFLLSLAFPTQQNKIEKLFSEIETEVLNGNVDTGLIIHENRFTYLEKGLHKIIDLGQYWESLIQSPIPLGGIVVKQSFDNKLKMQIDKLIRKSLEFAFSNPLSSKPFVDANAQEMSDDVKQKHINLYVNDFSLSLGEIGKKAVQLLFDKSMELGFINNYNKNIFVHA